MRPTLKIRIISLVKYHLSKMMKFKLLEQILHWIIKNHQLAEILFSHNQVSNMLSQIFFMAYIFFTIFLLLNPLCKFIERKSHLCSENNKERNWYYREETSAINDYREQQQRSYYQPSQYNERQHYRHNITTKRIFIQCIWKWEIWSSK